MKDKSERLTHPHTQQAKLLEPAAKRQTMAEEQKKVNLEEATEVPDYDESDLADAEEVTNARK